METTYINSNIYIQTTKGTQTLTKKKGTQTMCNKNEIKHPYHQIISVNQKILTATIAPTSQECLKDKKIYAQKKEM